MQAEIARQRTRRAYERGRVVTAARRAGLVLLPIVAMALASGERRALALLPVTFVAWMLAQWRGGALLRGAYYGLAGGAVTCLLPLTVLRPCCTPEAMARGGDCCTMPSACGVAGMLLGFGLAALVPAGPARWRTAAGIAVGLASVAVLRCATLFGAEAAGLMGGLVAGVFAGAAASAVFREQRR
jgi:hypothetical protein